MILAGSTASARTSSPSTASRSWTLWRDRSAGNGVPGRHPEDAWEPRMFTPYERRQLRLIEEWFEQDDPQLARSLRSGPTPKTSNAPQVAAISVAAALALLGIMTGAFMLLFGAM